MDEAQFARAVAQLSPSVPPGTPACSASSGSPKRSSAEGLTRTQNVVTTVAAHEARPTGADTKEVSNGGHPAQDRCHVVARRGLQGPDHDRRAQRAGGRRHDGRPPTPAASSSSASRRPDGFDMKVMERSPPSCVLWEVVDGPEEWVGTTGPVRAQAGGRTSRSCCSATRLAGAGGVHAPLQHQVGDVPDEPQAAASRPDTGEPSPRRRADQQLAVTARLQSSRGRPFVAFGQTSRCIGWQAGDRGSWQPTSSSDAGQPGLRLGTSYLLAGPPRRRGSSAIMRDVRRGSSREARTARSASTAATRTVMRSTQLVHAGPEAGHGDGDDRDVGQLVAGPTRAEAVAATSPNNWARAIEISIRRLMTPTRC